MFFKGLKEKTHHFFVKRNKNLQNRTYSSNKKHLNSTVLVLIDDISKKEEVKKELQSIFKSKTYNIDILIFQDKKNKNEDCPECIYASDFGWFGSIPSKKVNSILTKKYDLLINYCKIDYLYINTLLLHCKIAFKVSFSQLDNHFYDLQIDCDTNNIALFTKELKKYLIILNKL